MAYVAVQMDIYMKEDGGTVMAIVGPFDTDKAARAYVAAQPDNVGEDWEVTRLRPPSGGAGEQKP